MNRRGENPYESFKQKNTGKLRVSRSTELFSRRKRRIPILRILCAVVLIVTVLAGGYNAVVNRSVHVETAAVMIPGLPSALEGYTILHISDLYGAYLGEGHEKLTRALSGKTYSAVCITGDMAAPDGDTQAFLDLIEELQTKKPIFFVPGEQDPAALTEDGGLADYIAAAHARGAVYMDAPVYLESLGQKIWFTPESALTLDVDATVRTLSDRLSAQPDAEGAQVIAYQLDRAQRIRDTREQMLEEDVCVVLTHAPLDEAFISGTSEIGVVNQLISRMDLILAGHHNGGQFNLPFVGPVYLPGRGFFPGGQGVSGLSRTGEMLQHISPGLGVNPRHILPLRLFNPPTVTLVKLTGKMS